MKTYLTVPEAANYLGYNRFTIMLLVKNGNLKAYSYGRGGQLRFKQSDVKNFLKLIPADTDKFLKSGKNGIRKKTGRQSGH